MKTCQGFVKNNHQVTLIGLRKSLGFENIYKKYNVEPCFRVVRFFHLSPYLGKLRTWLYIKLITRELLKNKPDLIYSRHCMYLNAVATLGIPVIYEAHGVPRDKSQLIAQEQLFKRDNFKRLVVISGELKKRYLEIFPWLIPEEIVVAHMGTDLPQPLQSTEKEERWIGRSGHFQVGYVGHLYPKKGMEIIIDLVKSMPDIDFHIIGGMKKDIKKWKKVCNFNNIYYHGFVGQKELASYYQHFDAVVLPYVAGIYTNSPNKLFEYMAMAKAIVASDLANFREILRNNENALLVDPGNLEEWIEAINRLAKDPDFKKQIAEKAYSDVKTLYTWEIRSKNVLEGFCESSLSNGLVERVGERSTNSQVKAL
jgi:glycosyltransferase involved in cell wall biosynthesis